MWIFIKKVFRFLIVSSVIGLIILVLPSAIALIATRSQIKTDLEIDKPVAIVFGAGLRRDGTPTAVLRDRVFTAVQLYKDGKAKILLMSGDNQFVDYDEPTAMWNYAVQLGVPEEAIVRDYAGRRTYDTCYRAREIFGVTDAVLITQAYHMPRALYTCNALGIQAVGVQANQYRYWRRLITFWRVREIPATLVAFWDVHIAKPLPVLGEPEPIFPPSWAQ